MTTIGNSVAMSGSAKPLRQIPFPWCGVCGRLQTDSSPEPANNDDEWWSFDDDRTSHLWPTSRCNHPYRDITLDPLGEYWEFVSAVTTVTTVETIEDSIRDMRESAASASAAHQRRSRRVWLSYVAVAALAFAYGLWTGLTNGQL